MPELESFLEKNGIAKFTGIKHPSGFWDFPLYQFCADKLREICPHGMADYEKINGLDNKGEKDIRESIDEMLVAAINAIMDDSE